MSTEQLTKLALGLKIKEIRISRGISQKDLARELNITPSRLSNWENGVSSPDFSHLPDLSLNLGCSIDFLLGVTFNDNYADLIGGYELLNEKGRKKAVEYINDLVEIEKYRYGNK